MKALLLALALLGPAATAPLPTLRAGTPVPLTLDEAVSSKTHAQGDRVRLTLAEDVVADGRVLIPRGAPALAEIVRHRAKGGWGRAGLLELRLLHLEAGGRLVRLDGGRVEGGRDNKAAAVASGVIAAAVVGAVIHGKTATLPAGTRLVGTVHRDLALRPAAPASR